MAGVGTNRYGYSANDPVNLSDPGGNCPSCLGGLAGGIIGGLAQLGVDAYRGELSSLRSYAGSIAAGAVTGATFGLGSSATIGGLAARGGLSGAAGTVGGTVVGEGRLPTATELLIGTAIGGATGPVGRGRAPTTRAIGTVRSVNESMSDAARAYQVRVTGMQPGTAYVQNGVRFDGFVPKTNTLIEAKYGMDFMVDPGSGTFREWARFRGSALNQAERQIRAAKGANIQWRVSEPSVARALKDLFSDRGFDIDVVVRE